MTDDTAGSAFERAFTVALSEPEFAGKLAERNLSLHFVQADPAVELHVSADGVHAGPPPTPATLRFEMTTETADALWSGRLGLLPAVVARRLAIKGPTTALRQLTDLLPVVMRAYARAQAPLEAV